MMGPEPASASAAVTAERAAVWEDFVDIFYAPSAVFARRARGNFWIPFFVVSAAIGVLLYVTSGVLRPVFEAEFDRGMAAAMRSNPRITADGAQRFKDAFLRIGIFIGVIFVPLTIVCTGVATWLIGKLFGARQAFQSAMIVAAYAFVPRILESVLNGVQGIVLNPDDLNGRWRLSLGVGRFFDPDAVSPLLLAVVGRIDVFTIWVTLLLAIGVSVTGGISRSRAFMAAPLIWLAGALPGLLQGFRR